MKAESLKDLEFDELYSADDRSVRHRSAWPAWADEGTETAACVFEIEKGCRLGKHVHDAEEVVILVAGRARATIGDASREVRAPQIVVMPEGQWHDLENLGGETLRAVGVFPWNTVTTTFETEMEPIGSRLAGTPDH